MFIFNNFEKLPFFKIEYFFSLWIANEFYFFF